MPVIPQPVVGNAYVLTVGGVNYTARVQPETINISETAGESNAVLTFTIHLPVGIPVNALSQHVELRNSITNRKMFTGNLVRSLRRHSSAARVEYDYTCISYDAWLDRRFVPKWVSKRPNGTRILSDREMVQSVMNLTEAVPWVTSSNEHVDQTNANTPLIQLNQGGSVRDILAAIAEAAATAADPTARHFYIDFDQKLHYYKGAEGNPAPYRIGDASYTTTVKATSGLVSLWPLREFSGASAFDTTADANTITLAGGYTRHATGGVANEPSMAATTFNGTTAYGASVSDADLHPGNTFSVELWFKRATSGSVQTMISAGTDDFEIGFDATDHVVVYKEGTGNNFVTNATYTDASWHHLVVTRVPGTTIVYVDGESKAGTATARTFVSAGAAPINIGRRLSSTDRYYAGNLQNVAIYSSALSAATVLAHYQDANTVVPDYIEFETDVNGAGKAVYIRGGKAAGTGWVTDNTNANYSQTFVLDRPQSTSAALKNAIGLAFLKRDANESYGGRFTISGVDGWRAAQSVVIDDSALAINGTYEIKHIESTTDTGAEFTHEVYFGTMPWSGMFDVQRKRRK